MELISEVRFQRNTTLILEHESRDDQNILNQLSFEGCITVFGFNLIFKKIPGLLKVILCLGAPFLPANGACWIKNKNDGYHILHTRQKALLWIQTQVQNSA